MTLNLMQIDQAVNSNRANELNQKTSLRNLMRLEKSDADEMAMQDAFKNSYGPDGKLDPNRLVELLRGTNAMKAYEVQQGIESQQAEKQAAQQKAQGADLDYQVKLGSYARDTMAGATSQDWLQRKQDLIAKGVKSAESLPDQYDPEAHRAYIMKADDWLKQNAPKEQKIGFTPSGVAYDTNDPASIKLGVDYSKAEKSPAMPAAIQEYEYAKGQGFTGSLQDYQKSLKSANKSGLSATAQKELFEADETIEGSKSAIESFKQAMAINDKAMGGFGSGALATAGSVLPDFARPDTVDATKELDNILQNAALPQLKAIFGGMPTEGERAILLEVQGSSGQPAKVRKGIFERAIKAAEKRIKINEDKAQRLRAGTYFSDDGETLAAPIAKPAGGKSKVINGVTYINDGKGWKRK